MQSEIRKSKRTLLCQRCGKEIEWRSNRKYCTQCSFKQTTKKRKSRAERRNSPESGRGGKQVCKCPICGKLHKVKLNWTGNGIPRKNCESCLATDTLQAGIHYNLNYL